MATPVQQDLQSSNNEYANSFDKGELALPPAKKYLVGPFSSTPASPLSL